jgi:hypothetical protein
MRFRRGPPRSAKKRAVDAICRLEFKPDHSAVRAEPANSSWVRAGARLAWLRIAQHDPQRWLRDRRLSLNDADRSAARERREGLTQSSVPGHVVSAAIEENSPR